MRKKKCVLIHGMFKDVPQSNVVLRSIAITIATELANTTPLGKNKRCLKSQGTSKQISHCSSHIKATVNKESNVVTAEYNSTHYYHTTNLAHLRITDRSRQKIASKLRQSITPQRILDDIRDQHDSRITRTHLVTKKNLLTSKILLILKAYKSIKMI